MKITLKNNQSLYDAALQYYGSMEGLTLMLEDNPDLSLAQPLAAGQVVQLREERINNELVSYYEANNIKPANAGVTLETSAFSAGFLQTAFE